MSFQDVPVDVGVIYEGERIRREDMQVELGGPKVAKKFELVLSRPLKDVEDGKITVVGPDLPQMPVGSEQPLGILVEVAGKEIEEDLEGVLERHVHEYINFIEGMMHLNQRYDIWLRLSKKSYQKGFNSLKYVGKVLIRLFKSELPIIEKIQVTFYTDPKKIAELHDTAMQRYNARDSRARGLKDQDVDTFYGCTLCVPAGEDVVLANGAFMPIDQLIQTVVDERDVDVLTMGSTRLESGPVGELFIHPPQTPLVRVVLRNGNTLTLTTNHRVMVDSRQGLKWLPAGQLRPGDLVVTPKDTTLGEKAIETRTGPAIVDYLPADYQVLDAPILRMIRQWLLEKYAGNLAAAARDVSIPYMRLYTALADKPDQPAQRLTISELRRIIIALGRDWNELKREIRIFKGEATLHETCLDQDLLYLAGLVAADGMIRRRGPDGRSGVFVQFTNTEPALVERFASIYQQAFGRTARRSSRMPTVAHSDKLGITVTSRKPVTVCSAYDTLLGRLLEGLGIRSGLRNKSDEPKWHGHVISTLPTPLIAAFLRGLFDGDGHVTNTRCLITCCHELEARHIHLLLKKLGIDTYISRIRRGLQVGTRNADAFARFRDVVFSHHPSKQARLMAVQPPKDPLHVVRSDVVPLACTDLLAGLIHDLRSGLTLTRLPVDYKTLDRWLKARTRPSKRKLAALLGHLCMAGAEPRDPRLQELRAWTTSNILFEQIRTIESVPTPSKVYNFSVPGTHNYLINGVVVRNCQSFAPTHMCCITAQRYANCGAISWFDGRAAARVDPKGPLFSVPKGQVIDEFKGEYTGVNQAYKEKTLGAVTQVCLYSAFDKPHTSCGCFEAIAFVIPEVDGLGIVHRDYKGPSVNGLPFSTMADSTAGGRQIPGFHGLSIEYLRSPKFIQVDGGWKRVVWMPKAVKDRVGDFIPKDMIDKIPTENDVKSLDELKTYLKDHNHPVVECWAAVGAAARLEMEEGAAEAAMLPVPGTMVATVPGVGGGFQITFKNARIYAEKIIIRRQGEKKSK